MKVLQKWICEDCEDPNVIQLFQVVEIAEKVYLVMEHTDGGQLWHPILEATGM